jgi:hypothetical protein
MTQPIKPIYRVGNHQPQNVYRGEQHIGVMFSPEDAALVVAALNGDSIPKGEPPFLIDGEGDRFRRIGGDTYVMGDNGVITYTRAEIDSYGERETIEVWE